MFVWGSTSPSLPSTFYVAIGLHVNNLYYFVYNKQSYCIVIISYQPQHLCMWRSECIKKGPLWCARQSDIYLLSLNFGRFGYMQKSIFHRL